MRYGKSIRAALSVTASEAALIWSALFLQEHLHLDIQQPIGQLVLGADDGDVGSDADVTVLDPAEKRTVTAARLHEADYTPWEGFEADIWPTVVVLRGKVVMEDGEFTGDVKDGQYLKRKVAENIRSHPAIG